VMCRFRGATSGCVSHVSVGTQKIIGAIQLTSCTGMHAVQNHIFTVRYIDYLCV